MTTTTETAPLLAPLESTTVDWIVRYAGIDHRWFRGRDGLAALAYMSRLTDELPDEPVHLAASEPLEHDHAFDMLAAHGVELWCPTEPGGQLMCQTPSGDTFGPFEDAAEAYFTIMGD